MTTSGRARRWAAVASVLAALACDADAIGVARPRAPAAPAGSAVSAAPPMPSLPDPTDATPPVAPPVLAGAGSFVRVRGATFELGSAPITPVGQNVPYVSTLSPAALETLATRLAARGFTVVRLFAFADCVAGRAGPQGPCFAWYDSTTRELRPDDAGLVALDRAVAVFARHGLRSILVLTNNWIDYGGADALNAVCGSTRHAEFYTGTCQRRLYQQWMATLLARVNADGGVAYRDDRRIMAFELINEPRCSGSIKRWNGRPWWRWWQPRCTAATLTTWASEMARQFERRDGNHLLAFGDEGIVPDAPESDAAAVSRVPGLDYLTLHLWPDLWDHQDRTAIERRRWGSALLDAGLASLRGAGRPVLVAELGFDVRDLPERRRAFTEWTSLCAARPHCAGFLGWVPIDDAAGIRGGRGGFGRRSYEFGIAPAGSGEEELARAARALVARPRP